MRLVQVVAPEEKQSQIKAVLDDHTDIILHSWQADLVGEQIEVTILVRQEDSQEILDGLDRCFSDADAGKWRINLQALEATVPDPMLNDTSEEEVDEPEDEKEKNDIISLRLTNISREELYSTLSSDLELNLTNLLALLLSVLIAAVGLILDDVAIVIGAMVIAPLLKPIVALSFAATLGDLSMGIQAARYNVIGVGGGLLVSMGIGYIFDMPDDSVQINSRTILSVGSIFLALLAGSAGALSITSKVADRLIGVTVAVALIPPLVAAGLLLGEGEWLAGTNALILVFINISGINIAAMSAFWLQGIRPRRWYEAQEAKRSARIAFILWVVLLGLFGIAVYYL